MPTAGSSTPIAIRRLAAWAGFTIRRFGHDRRGSVATFVAISLLPIVASIGIGVDGARAYLARARLSQALDAAALAGGRVMYETTRNADIAMYFNANFPQGFMGATVSGPTASGGNISVDTTGQIITVTASATLPTTFMQVVGQTTMTVNASTTVTRANSGLEVVLVMDNTGSMNSNGKMSAMKSAAQSLVDTLYGGNDTVNNLYVGLVPFVAMANVGTGHSGWTAASTNPLLTVGTLTRTSNSGPSNPNTSTVCVTTALAHNFKDGIVVDISGAAPATYNGRYQIRTGTANSTTGCTINSGNAATRFWFILANVSSASPANGPIRVQRPPQNFPSSSGYTTSNGAWKGCVEMRADPYETTSADAAPSTAAFVKAFWPSTKNVRWADTVSSSSYFKYMMMRSSSGSDYVVGDNEWTSSSIDEKQSSGNSGYGPNKGCASAITPLQPNKSVVTAGISAMQPWWGGGTAVPTGLAWGWRALSPNYRGLWGSPTPATLPLDYGTEKMSKVVVLLTDGKNEVIQGSSNGDMPSCNGTLSAYRNYKCPQNSDYTAYDRMSDRRFGASVDTKDEFTTELNNRITSLCAAMKEKKIIIYAILLQVNDAATDLLYKNCATKPEYYFNSPSASDLAGIFNTIAQQLSKLRVAQ
jgi:Flp pilus assembly protein TadG